MSKIATDRQRRMGERFLALHQARPGFIMPNAWDAGSAAVLEAAGFQAIATTSAGIAFSLGRPDYHPIDPELAVSRETMFARIREIVDAVDIPVSADLEAGYGDSPEAVAATIGMAIDLGLAGANIEDKIPAQPALYDEDLAVARIAAARSAARGASFVLTARTDALMWRNNGLAEAIRRANRYRAAGADCLYAPAPYDRAVAATLAKEIDGPINVVLGLGGAKGNARELFDAGVQRISLGGSIARAALGFVRKCAAELLDAGTIAFAEAQIPQDELNALYSRRHS
jgi:2-methylisocitrate lyase-like PEP mutase family enzyme